ncbi:S-layer homology domain-containing protein [Paenibacillus borealis]|uniref:SLH domain-containing protein n=1 Tax=Paenibacillus borealis TaxID=160799 RepID=A0A089L9N4_PAEBO|nr:S-layer homology domain-containing protein [Paenibacillus borealis]AIQ57517.1 hypothetical protein PBOR_11680 [Paenibacillus borealis]
MNFRSIVTVGLSLCLVLGSSGNIYAATADYEGHWAQKQISHWIEKGWLKGLPDGSVKPDQEISRAEFVTLINRSFDITDASKAAVFSDLPKTSWAYSEFSKAIGAGYIEGFDGTIRPNAPITRQEAAMIIFRLLMLEAGPPEVLSQFSDSDQIAGWSKSEVAAVVAAGAMKGYPDGRFAPARAMTRAEAIALLDIFTIVSGGLESLAVSTSEGFDGSAPADFHRYNNVTVSTHGVTLQNMVIYGDLLLDEAIGEGEVTLTNVDVKGKVIVHGADSVQLKDSTLKQMIVQKKSGTARLVAEGSTLVTSVSAQSGVELEEGGVAGAGFTEINLPASLPAGIVVTLSGIFGAVNIEAKGSVLHLKKGSVSTLNVVANAAGLKVELDQGTTVTRAILNAATNVTGAGRVLAATVNEGAKGSSFANKPASLDGSQKDSITISAALPAVASSGGSNGDSGSAGGNTTIPAALPLISGITVTQGPENMYTNSAAVLLNLEGLSPEVQAAADHPGYYFTAAAESAPVLNNVHTTHLPDMSPRFLFPAAPEQLKEYMTVILYDKNGQAIGYNVVKLNLSAKYALLNEQAVRFTSGVGITRDVRDGLIRDRIAVEGEWIAQHPEAKFYSYVANTQLPYITNAARDFNIKHVSSQILYLEQVTNDVYGISFESFADYAAPLYSVPDFQEQYMVVFYDNEMNVAGYYQGASVLSDQQAADTVAYKINQLPAAAGLTLADKKAVNWAYGRYMGLTDAQKALLEGTAVNKIIALKAAADQL